MDESTAIICVGNALIDMFLTIHDANAHCRIDGEKRLSITLGEKVLLDASSLQLGGNACNVAVGLSRLGYDASLMAEIGSDAFAEKIWDDLAREQVGTALLHSVDGPSSFAMGLNFQAERVLFVQHMQRAHDFHLTGAKATGVYLTSLGDEWYTAYNRVHTYVREQHAALYFNPGSHQLAAGRDPLLPFLRDTDILFVNKEEAEVLAGTGKKEVPVLLSSLQSLGCKRVSITDGNNGSYCIDTDGTMYKLGIAQIEVVERTGAGDGYATGFLGGVLAGEPLSGAMRWGALNAAAVVAAVGAEPGLLTRDEMKKRLAENESLQAAKI